MGDPYIRQFTRCIIFYRKPTHAIIRHSSSDSFAIASYAMLSFRALLLLLP